jgi:hypothetical protein
VKAKPTGNTATAAGSRHPADKSQQRGKPTPAAAAAVPDLFRTYTLQKEKEAAAKQKLAGVFPPQQQPKPKRKAAAADPQNSKKPKKAASAANSKPQTTTPAQQHLSSEEPEDYQPSEAGALSPIAAAQHSEEVLSLGESSSPDLDFEGTPTPTAAQYIESPAAPAPAAVAVPAPAAPAAVPQREATPGNDVLVQTLAETQVNLRKAESDRQELNDLAVQKGKEVKQLRKALHSSSQAVKDLQQQVSTLQQEASTLQQQRENARQKLNQLQQSSAVDRYNEVEARLQSAERGVIRERAAYRESYHRLEDTLDRVRFETDTAIKEQQLVHSTQLRDAKRELHAANVRFGEYFRRKEPKYYAHDPQTGVKVTYTPFFIYADAAPESVQELRSSEHPRHKGYYDQLLGHQAVSFKLAYKAASSAEDHATAWWVHNSRCVDTALHSSCVTAVGVFVLSYTAVGVTAVV